MTFSKRKSHLIHSASVPDKIVTRRSYVEKCQRDVPSDSFRRRKSLRPRRVNVRPGCAFGVRFGKTKKHRSSRKTTRPGGRGKLSSPSGLRPWIFALKAFVRNELLKQIPDQSTLSAWLFIGTQQMTLLVTD